MNDYYQDSPDPVQITLWQKMGAERRSQLGRQLRNQVLRAKRSRLAAQNPDWTDQQINRTAAAYILRGQS